jgi:hypothetical protein
MTPRGLKTGTGILEAMQELKDLRPLDAARPDSE